MLAAGRWREGDPEILAVLDAGSDAPRIHHLLAGLPVQILGRLRSDRVMRRTAPTRAEFALANPAGGRPGRVEQADPGPGAAGAQEPPPAEPDASASTETLPARPRAVVE